jgi:photosystem II stability/assembly factor-like uncharacterized protein
MRNIIPCLLCLVLLLGCTDTSYQFDFLEANTPGQSSLRAIYAVDEEVVWTSGSQGLVYLSVNGGEDWSQFSVPGCEDTEFRSLHAWDAKRAMVFDVSPEGRAFMTTDGGTSWEQVYASPTEGAFFNSLKFADNKRGLAISDPIDSRVFILKTEDGGWTWERMESAPEATEGEINFAASNTCIEYLPNGQIYIVTGGNKARVLTSYDHGKNWEFRESPMMSGASAGLFSISFSGPKTGVAVGGDFNDPARPGVKAMYTLDGGKNWQEAQSIPAEYRSCVVSLGKGLFFAIGKTGCNYSSDKGKHWIFLDTTGYYAASALGEGNTLFLSGSEGRVAKVLVRRKP